MPPAHSGITEPPATPGWGARLGALLRLSAREWGALARAQVALLAAELAVRTRRTGALLVPADAVWPAPVPQDGAEPDGPVGSATTIADRRAIWAEAQAVHRAARYGVFRPRCLTRAIALQRLLARRGWPARVRVGVCREGDALLAHAWVELDGAILGDRPEHVARYTPLAGFDAR